MPCPLNVSTEKFEEWAIADPQTDEELRATRDELVEKIKTLIGEEKVFNVRHRGTKPVSTQTTLS
ncbi:MAG: hypothetical protein U5L75_01500 [Candidatus Campbellbacteria bacterium]|nr:hypothetical protein [Candidatus Campbellbacteria bacterium]